ncbi:MAG TPA: Na+/H+ antiporter subunit E [Methylomirabilota bacterium]|nr:Na+/H+ antiporter subunit E [Methylomirabilota bacterium]
MTASILLFVACFALWLVLSGHFGLLEIALGVASAAAVTAANRNLEALSPFLRVAPRLLAYGVWLLREIVVANLQVTRVVLHPRMPIEPVVSRFEVTLPGDLAIATLANSITLTPGTITLDIEGRALVVHALLGPASVLAAEGEMARRVGRVFAGRMA